MRRFGMMPLLQIFAARHTKIVVVVGMKMILDALGKYHSLASLRDEPALADSNSTAFLSHSSYDDSGRLDVSKGLRQVGLLWAVWRGYYKWLFGRY
jgi:hypothetical protein